MDPKDLSGSRHGLEAAPGSHPNPLLSHSSGGSSAASTPTQRSGAGGGAGAGGSVDGPLQAAAVAAEGLQRLALSPEDHPLSTSSSSKWRAYFQASAGPAAAVSLPACLPPAAQLLCGSRPFMAVEQPPLNPLHTDATPPHLLRPLAGRGGAGAD